MKTFRDSEGREWTLRVTVLTAKALRSAGVDILDGECIGIGKISSDPVTMATAIYVCLKDQIEKRGLTEEQFFDGLSGDSIDAATNAMIEAIIDFFPPARRSLLKKAFNRAQEMQEKAIQLAEEKIGSMDFASVTSSQG